MKDLKQLLGDCRVEMGPKVFREFQDDLAGKKPAYVPKMTCAICNGSGSFRGGDCGACKGIGKF